MRAAFIPYCGNFKELKATSYIDTPVREMNTIS